MSKWFDRYNRNKKILSDESVNMAAPNVGSIISEDLLNEFIKISKENDSVNVSKRSMNIYELKPTLSKLNKKKMVEKILFVTGKLAERQLQRILNAMKPEFSYKINQIGVSVAALMSENILMRRVEKDKGIDRPFNSISDRIYALQSLKAVDKVEVFSSKEHLEYILAGLKPDIIVVGSDWKNKEIVGGHSAKKIVYFNRIGNYSTTNILNNARK